MQQNDTQTFFKAKKMDVFLQWLSQPLSLVKLWYKTTQRQDSNVTCPCQLVVTFGSAVQGTTGDMRFGGKIPDFGDVPTLMPLSCLNVFNQLFSPRQAYLFNDSSLDEPVCTQISNAQTHSYTSGNWSPSCEPSF